MKMRKMRKITICILLTSVFFTACKDFLDTEPLFEQDAENYFNSEDEYRLALIGAYDLMQGSFQGLFVGEIASDNSIAGGESVNDTQGLHEIDDMTHGGVNNELRNIFRWNYAGITRANYILENRNKTDFPGRIEVIAEATFLRAYYYFQLVKYFGGVPLVVDKRLGSDELTEIDRASREQVYAQIEADLIFAAENLAWSNPIKGHVDKGVALSMLGKVYLYQNKFAQSAEVLDQVINSGNYQLISDYTNLFSLANEGHSETVFDIEYTGLEGGGYDCFICLEGNAAPGFHGIRQYDGPVYGDGNSYNLPTQDLYDAFAAEDSVRRDATILDIEAFIAKQDNPSLISYAIGAGGNTGYYNNKYIKRKGETGLPDDDLTSPVNYRVIRYADVLLMAAEAHNRSGNDGLALTYVNQVRDRAGVSPLLSGGQQLTEEIWEERRFELSGEGHRFFDLVRTGQAADNITGFVNGKHELFPIPLIEISLAGGNWNQNPGY